ncbi:SpoIIE family protein phosphatase [Streptomyces sp. NPDC054933]
MRELPVPVRRTASFTFDTGDVLLLYTDGVIEARSPNGSLPSPPPAPTRCSAASTVTRSPASASNPPMTPPPWPSTAPPPITSTGHTSRLTP